MDGRLIGGRYRLLEQRGMGGTAAVWSATDERTGRQVAVKLLHPHLAADRAARERLQREALAMGGIDHPNVVAVRDLVLDDDRPALIMDLIEGQSLAEAIATTGALPEADAARIACEAADGLAAVHAAGLVHRDLKPANILLGSDGRARVTDLGIAASADPGDTALTASDGVAGTLRYLAPERLQGQAAVPATDIWGLGVIMVEMLTGVPAFPATSIQARVGEAAQGVIRPDGIADPIWAIVERATATDPATRYATAAELAADLRAVSGAPLVRPLADADPWADTAVIPLRIAPPTLAPSPIEPSPLARHRAPLVPILSAAALVFVVAVAAALGGSAGGTPDRSLEPAVGAATPAVPDAAPTEALPATAAPASIDPDESDEEVSEEDKPGKGDGHGKGKGKDDQGAGRGSSG